MQSKPIHLMGVRVDPIDVKTLHQLIAYEVEQAGHVLLNHVNVHGLNLAYGQPWLRTFLNSSRITFCDGFGVILGARILGYTLPHRITYADWIWQLAEFAEAQNFSFFFLGGRPGVADRAAARLKALFQGVRILGVQHGYFSKEAGSSENESVVDNINRLRPNILIVGLGMPVQERWLMDNWDRIHANIGLTGGAVFDYVSGTVPRAPRWMADHGLEWLGRLIIDPQRLWRRYLIGNPLFIWRVAEQRLKRKTIAGSREPKG